MNFYILINIYFIVNCVLKYIKMSKRVNSRNKLIKFKYTIGNNSKTLLMEFHGQTKIKTIKNII